MDVTGHTFPYHLPKILDDLSSCTFVSLDFEFSGIATTVAGRGPQSLQQRYQEVKECADKYQILQVGMTTCHEDTLNATYTLKPYNLYLNPIIDRKLEVERTWSFQSGAVEFLLENKFSMDALHRDGVPYLSREEEARAISKVIERHNRSALRRSLDVKETEYESIEFLKIVRQLVDAWLALGDKREHYLNIPPPTRLIQAQKLRSLPSVLNRFQKRLVHQLIEAEYPSLVSIGKPTFVQIIDYNEEREKAIRDQRVKWVEEHARRQTGFRWVAEALVGGDLSNLDPHSFSILSTNNAQAGQRSYALKDFSDRLKERLKSHRLLLVGHNLFTDLIYFCRTFFGPLPDRLEDFQSLVHDLFPLLVDTKYMATHNCGSINPRSSLQEINDSLLQTPIPAISIHPQFAKYHTQKIDHEAGYDSLLTAQVFIKLSAQLRGEQSTVNASPELRTSKASPRAKRGSSRRKFKLHELSEALDEVDNSRARVGEQPALSSEEVRKANNGELIPRSGSPFWSIYANKIRVFGTEERVCNIG
ncbi:hypothetical protein ARAM_007082 [Aspergillus rambellii]|uniref:Uncharacterized protein n=1 Tax=Aspergillus rambellii TaxID=308745 RepID=A0A0F8V5G7_9EURO|nr:hypothetical protein ARAM_007082 [Aspergillus rambellii]